MTLYVDSSALAKRYVAEADSDTAEAILATFDLRLAQAARALGFTVIGA